MRGSIVRTICLGILVTFLALSMVSYPESCFRAASRGVEVWWDIVLPALLPFFIAAELLMALGVVHFMGVLMEPLMRPLFNVPGAGSFVMAMGIASGYPLGAALSARLKDDGLATKAEAERLMCVSNTSDPLFMAGAVSVGMFKRADLALVIAGSHYASALLLGLALRFWKRDAPATSAQPGRSHSVRRAYAEMRDAQARSEKPFGELLGDSVKQSLNTLLLILGFMVLFSVVFEILHQVGVAGALSAALSALVPESVLPKALHQALVSGFFEITIGTSMAAAANVSLQAKVALCSGIIAWSGLSVHAQVAAVTGRSGLSLTPYSISRFVQGLMAALISVVIFRVGGDAWSVPTIQSYQTDPKTLVAWVELLGAATTTCVALIAGLATVTAAAAAYRHYRKDPSRP